MYWVLVFKNTRGLAKAELGRYPVMGIILKQTYCYWQPLKSAETSLLYKALQVNISLDKKGFMT